MKTDPGRREEPAHLPDAQRRSRRRTTFDPKALINPKYKQQFQNLIGA